MSTVSHITAEQLAALPSDGKRYELVQGELKVMSPAGGRHGRIAMKLSLRIGNFVEANQLGETFAAETGFLIETNPDTVRAPDVAFVCSGTSGDYIDHAGYLPIVPELVAGVVSPSDCSSDVEEKAAAWIAAGVRSVLVVDPQTKTVRHYTNDSDIHISRDGELDLGDVVSGFTLNIAELFA